MEIANHALRFFFFFGKKGKKTPNKTKNPTTANSIDKLKRKECGMKRNSRLTEVGREEHRKAQSVTLVLE